MDLLIGATGILGSQLARRLQAAGRSFKAMVRTSSDPAKRQALAAMGAEIVVGDLKDEETLRAACAGVTNVISTASSTLSRCAGDDIDSVDREGHLSLIAAARAAGVKHFVYVSFPGMRLESALQSAKRAVEDALRQSGLSYTILQPTYFYEVWCSPAFGFDAENAKARVFGEGEGPIHWISMFDVADAAVASLDNPRAANQTFLMGGPEVLTQNEIVRRCEKLTGRSFEREVIPLEVLAEQHRTATDPLARTFAALSHLCGEGGWVFDSNPMREALGIQSRSVDAYLEQVCGRTGAK
ncbi:MAG: SDR family oxidoreductase [Polyangiaceae bacterium]|nr:SDR family oxidoreductase [Polyangiaceae bacterium]